MEAGTSNRGVVSLYPPVIDSPAPCPPVKTAPIGRKIGAFGRIIVGPVPTPTKAFVACNLSIHPFPCGAAVLSVITSNKKVPVPSSFIPPLAPDPQTHRVNTRTRAANTTSTRGAIRKFMVVYGHCPMPQEPRLTKLIDSLRLGEASPQDQHEAAARLETMQSRLNRFEALLQMAATKLGESVESIISQ